MSLSDAFSNVTGSGIAGTGAVLTAADAVADTANAFKMRAKKERRLMISRLDRSNCHDADAFGRRFENLQADSRRQMHLKRVRPGHGDNLPALEADQRLTCTGVLQVGDDGTRRAGPGRIPGNAAMTGDACRRKNDAQRHRSCEHGRKATENAQGEQSSEG